MKKTGFFLVSMILLTFSLFAQQRSFDEIFPHLPLEIKSASLTENGFIRSMASPLRATLVGSTIHSDICGIVLDKSPGFLVEYLIVIPREKTLLEVYNALGNIRDLKGRKYQSHSRGDSVSLFEDATRIESAQRNNPVPDPRPSFSVPRSETVYIRLKDANFGNSYYRGDMSLNQFGLHYSLTNYRNLTYFFVPVIREEKFTALLYFEPIAEGILLYSIAGADVSDFISNRIDLPSAIRKRLEVIISWVVDGLSL